MLPSFDHPLHHHPLIWTDGPGWYCDGTNNIGGCLSGIDKQHYKHGKLTLLFTRFDNSLMRYSLRVWLFVGASVRLLALSPLWTTTCSRDSAVESFSLATALLSSGHHNSPFDVLYWSSLGNRFRCVDAGCVAGNGFDLCPLCFFAKVYVTAFLVLR